MSRTVVIHNPGDATTHESWTRGIIRETVARHGDGLPALHIVEVNGFKWDSWAPFGAYDGVPLILVREIGAGLMEWVDQWPRLDRSRSLRELVTQ